MCDKSNSFKKPNAHLHGLNKIGGIAIASLLYTYKFQIATANSYNV